MSAQLRRQNPEDERINVPAISNYFWRYRMHVTLETLNQSQPFNQDLKDAINKNGRA
jgi:4-alpha-glucanotransferase